MDQLREFAKMDDETFMEFVGFEKKKEKPFGQLEAKNIKAGEISLIPLEDEDEDGYDIDETLKDVEEDPVIIHAREVVTRIQAEMRELKAFESYVDKEMESFRMNNLKEEICGLRAVYDDMMFELKGNKIINLYMKVAETAMAKLIKEYEKLTAEQDEKLDAYAFLKNRLQQAIMLKRELDAKSKKSKYLLFNEEKTIVEIQIEVRNELEKLEFQEKNDFNRERDTNEELITRLKSKKEAAEYFSEKLQLAISLKEDILDKCLIFRAEENSPVVVNPIKADNKNSIVSNENPANAKRRSVDVEDEYVPKSPGKKVKLDLTYESDNRADDTDSASSSDEDDPVSINENTATQTQKYEYTQPQSRKNNDEYEEEEEEEIDPFKELVNGLNCFIFGQTVVTTAA